MKHVQHLELRAVCRLPKEGEMAECKSCGKWFHRHCVDNRPDALFLVPQMPTG